MQRLGWAIAVREQVAIGRRGRRGMERHNLSLHCTSTLSLLVRAFATLHRISEVWSKHRHHQESAAGPPFSKLEFVRVHITRLNVLLPELRDGGEMGGGASFAHQKKT